MKDKKDYKWETFNLRKESKIELKNIKFYKDFEDADQVIKFLLKCYDELKKVKKPSFFEKIIKEIKDGVRG